ncbi:sucrose-6F-phosphate phosphohydrolase-domain-containing protein [Dunaliella salina]|uniref:Sucrose-6F-phosphate phosphohydrolase-domain-containing protein n=1 Tax=Dunaliella salina TaxID=3046 RepID=A0ABQ7GKS3_DUNSA|nr:sucrose-6F-phosphate phosphohydrolase-domain-containing protein [Dunaliella salina]|eukprot:KAF5835213.1 sucrose-6F-phosphate phosphohydrolase-domain-containing protein [Dunaliella salina]
MQLSLHRTAPGLGSSRPQSQTVCDKFATGAAGVTSVAPPRRRTGNERRGYARKRVLPVHGDRSTRPSLSAVLQEAPTQQPSPQSSIDMDPSTPLVPTHFVWHGEARSVEVVGSWSNWQKPVRMHCAGEGHPHRAIISLPPGSVQYKYRVNGVWRTCVKETRVSSNEGHLNNLRVVQPTIQFSFDAPDARRVFVVGDWDGWLYSMPLKRNPATGTWVGSMQLRPGRYNYQYVLDSRITHNPAEECGIVQGRGVVNVGWAVEPDMFRIFYCTGWDEAVLEYRRVGPNGERRKGMESLTMVGIGGHGSALGRWYCAAVVPMAEGESMEFYVHNGKEGDERKEDRPSGTHNRACAVIAGTLASNMEGHQAVRQACPDCLTDHVMNLHIRLHSAYLTLIAHRFMLVSDIDGTMVGDVGNEGPGAFHSSGRFKEYWENAAVLGGSILVYNTGRSLGSVRELLRSQPQVAEPDAVISAVGTKVFLNMDEAGRGRTSGDGWAEDMEWTRRLDQGWDLQVVRRHARSLMNRYDISQLSVLDDGSEHQHRYSLTAELSIVGEVVREMADSCRRDGLDVRLIASGNGSHRYVDCVPRVAGKEKALQYLRDKFDIPDHYCVAAGDRCVLFEVQV